MSGQKRLNVPRAPQIGDIVEIVKQDNTYANWHNWPGLIGTGYEDRWVKYLLPLQGGIYTIVGEWGSSWGPDYLIQCLSGIVYIVADDSFRLLQPTQIQRVEPTSNDSVDPFDRAMGVLQ